MSAGTAAPAGDPGPDVLARPMVERADPRRMIDDVVAQPHHLRAAVTMLRAVDLPHGEFPGGLVVCGIGGSALAGELAAAIAGSRARRPIQTVRGYLPEPWVGPGTFVFCPSYSGGADTTLAYCEAAHDAGAETVALTSGGRLADLAERLGLPLVRVPTGFQPRALTSYSIVAALRCASAAGAAPDLLDEIVDATRLLDGLVAEWGPDSPPDSLAKSLAHAVRDASVVVYGSGPTTPVAHRWKTQLNETGKKVAFSSELLEADHHELCVWGHLDVPSAWSVLMLGSRPDQHPRAVHRMQLTAELVAATGAAVHRVEARGETRAERILSLVLLADFVSVYTAALGGSDPSDIGLITVLNDALR